MAIDPQRLEAGFITERDLPLDEGGQLPETPDDELFPIAFEKARRLVAAELELARLRGQILESNLKITEAQLELAERQLDQLVTENQRLRRENEALKLRVGE